MATTKKHYSSLGHQFNGIFHELFDSFEEAQEFAKSIGSEVHLYRRRNGGRCWNDDGVQNKPIEMKADDEDAQWFERVEGAHEILTGMDDFNDWYEGYKSRIIQAFNDLEQAKEMVEFAANLLRAVEDLEEGEEAVAVGNDSFDIIELHPTAGEYDNRIWTLGVPDKH